MTKQHELSEFDWIIPFLKLSGNLLIYSVTCVPWIFDRRHYPGWLAMCCMAWLVHVPVISCWWYGSGTIQAVGDSPIVLGMFVWHRFSLLVHLNTWLVTATLHCSMTNFRHFVDSNNNGLFQEDKALHHHKMPRIDLRIILKIFSEWYDHYVSTIEHWGGGGGDLFTLYPAPTDTVRVAFKMAEVFWEFVESKSHWVTALH